MSTNCRSKDDARVAVTLRSERTGPQTEIGVMGPLGTVVPETRGGTGACRVRDRLFARDIRLVNGGYRPMVSVRSSLATPPIHACRPEAQRETCPTELAVGELIRCFGLTAPHAPGRAQIGLQPLVSARPWKNFADTKP